ncbi:hypothetical protein ASG92_14710 [Arthrobacter sp. Soil736]|nr:hypothetical protein ASG92_14710 [Arthrobacter sp. Soil736]
MSVDFGLACYRGAVESRIGQHPQHGVAAAAFGVAQIHQEIGLTKSFASTPEEGGECVGGDVEKRRGLARLQPFNLDIPKDSLPTKGEGREGLRDEVVLLRAAMEPVGVLAVSQLDDPP